MAPPEHDRHRPQPTSERAALGGDVASQALNEALRVSFRLLKLAMVLVAGLFLLSGVFTVKQYERAFVLRFGQIVTRYDARTGKETSVLEPGLHFAWPFLIDEIVRFPVQRVLVQSVDAFWYKEPKEAPGQTVPSGIAPGQGGYTLTGDANILHSNWRIQYQIADPVRFCQTLADPSALAAERPTGAVRDLMSYLLRNAVIRTVARFRVDDAYQRGQAELRSEVKAGLIAQLKELRAGIEISDVILVTITPPLQTKDAFNEVTQAEQENRTLVHNAQGDADQTLRQAKAQASELVAKAMAYKNQARLQAEADAKYIRDLLAKYPNDPHMLSLFLQQRLIEVVEEVLKAAEERFVLKADSPEGRREIRIMLNRQPKVKREGEPQQPKPEK